MHIMYSLYYAIMYNIHNIGGAKDEVSGKAYRILNFANINFIAQTVNTY